MKRAISYDENGKIFLLFDPSTAPNAKFRLKYTPKPGEQHYHFDIPPEHERKTNRELFDLLCVEVVDGQPRLKPRPKTS